ncbi:uncharacterized protein LOC125516024 [Triticum urartu]|uniref:uncharacterized protein LOC125515994 n=1 Tax=Triticum urartu TaxID=4572 RepID=UPI0020431642|nr:uncharacterized protein LOC125515994 [Triticum urartu]XP_048537463.1 uncharacterized protein LOC125516024 [Triticum urartu]
MSPPPPSSPALAPAATAPSAAHAGQPAASWFMPLPPPPPGLPAAGSARPASLPRPTGGSWADLVSPPSHGRGAGTATDSEFVPESPLGAGLRGSGSVAPSTRAAAGSARAASGSGFHCEVGDGNNCAAAGARSSPSPPTACSSMPATSAGREADVTGAWHLVKSRRGPCRPALPAQAFTSSPIPWWLKGRCCRCLAPGHRASACREPFRCSHCLQNGHRARGCKNKWRPLSSLPCLAFIPPPPLPRPAAAVVQDTVPVFGPGRGWPLLQPPPQLLLGDTNPVMSRLGDAANRPEEDFVVVPATPEMQAESVLLSTNAAVAWFEGAREDVPCHTVAAAFAATFGFRPADVSVVRHFPEQYLVKFMYQHNCADAVNRGDFLVGNSSLFVRAWRLEVHADNEDMMHHVRLCIEGIPVHAWNEYVAAFVIGRRCSLDYIEQRSLRREDTRDLSLWAWTSDPNAIPKVKWLTLPARGLRRRGRRGLRHRVLLHLDLLEDHSKARDDDDPPPPDLYEYTWFRRTVDGTVRRGDRRAGQPSDVKRPARRDDDDDRGGRRGRDGPRAQGGWRDRIRRSLSRGARDRQRQDGQERSRDRSSGKGGRRHGAEAVAALGDAAPAVPPLVLMGSGSASDEGADALELQPVRGRSPARQGSPRAARRRS